MAEAQRSLEFTPTWALATVCTVFVTISLLVVFGIESLEKWLKDKHRKPLGQALEKMKEELMLLGFISLLLTVFQDYVASICVSDSTLAIWTPCNIGELEKPKEISPEGAPPGRRLLGVETWPMMNWITEPLFTPRRILAGGKTTSCKAGKGSFVSKDGLHELHIFIFVLACVHIVYSLCAMVFASLKVNGWRNWEDKAHEDSHDSLTEITSLTFKRQSTFATYHTSKPWSRNRLAVWIVCFFRQFGQSVTEVDYLTLRLGFIKNHNTGDKFDFHAYMTRSLEDEFQCVVGISVSLWFYVILALLFNVNGTNLYFWLSFAPLVMVLLVGTKLQHIIATLALENAGIAQGGHFAGQSLKPRDELFWFSSPALVLWAIHFILFQNAFELATFLWYRWQFGRHSCLLKDRRYVLFRLIMGALVQILCSYSTLPLYAIVTQMGSQYKQAIFQEHVQDKLRKWRRGAQKRAKHGEHSVSHVGSTSHDGGSGADHDDDSSHGHKSVRPAQSTVVAADDVPLSALELSKVTFEDPTASREYRSDGPEEKKFYKQVSTIMPRDDMVPPPFSPRLHSLQ